MMNRHERRKMSKGRPKPKPKPTGTVEVFTMTFKEGPSIHLHVERMWVWAKSNRTPLMFPFSEDYVLKLLGDGTVTETHLMTHTAKQRPKPILVCERPNGEGDQIVDGNHAYVAAYLDWMKAREEGVSLPPGTPGYVLTEPEWRPFEIQRLG